MVRIPSASAGDDPALVLRYYQISVAGETRGVFFPLFSTQSFPNQVPGSCEKIAGTDSRAGRKSFAI